METRRDRIKACPAELSAGATEFMTPTPPLTYQFNATEVITDFVKKHRLAVEALTETQLAEAIRQAIACGDFVRHIVVDGRRMLAHEYSVTHSCIANVIYRLAWKWVK